MIMLGASMTRPAYSVTGVGGTRSAAEVVGALVERAVAEWNVVIHRVRGGGHERVVDRVAIAVVVAVAEGAASRGDAVRASNKLVKEKKKRILA